MNRHGRCRMCERVTEFRDVVFHGSAHLECLPCGDMIPHVALVEMLSPTQVSQLDDMGRNSIIDGPTRKRLISGAHPDVPDAWLKPLSKLDDGSVKRTVATDRALGQRLQQIQDQEERAFAKVGEDYEHFVTETAAGMIQAAQLETARKRIAELEATRPGHSVGCDRKLADAQARIAELEDLNAWAKGDVEARRAEAKGAHERANRLSDECGRLETLTRDLAVENSNLRRKLEAAERKGGKL